MQGWTDSKVQQSKGLVSPNDADFSEPSPDVPELTQERLITMLPADLLQGGELVVLLQKPSPWYILLESLRFLALLSIVLIPLVWFHRQGYNIGVSARDLLLLGGGLAGGRVFWQFLEWLSRVYILTDRRVIRVKGVLRVQVFEAPLQNIQHTNSTFSLRERLLGLGSIHIATAGTDGIEASWVMLANPLEVHRILVQTLNRYGK